MLQLYSAGGSSSLQILSPRYQRRETEDTLLFNVCQLLAVRGQTKAASYLATLGFSIFNSVNDFNDEFCVLSTSLSLIQYEFLRANIEHDAPNRKEFKDLFTAIASAISEIGPYIRFITCDLDSVEPPENWRTDLSQSISNIRVKSGSFHIRR